MLGGWGDVMSRPRRKKTRGMRTQKDNRRKTQVYNQSKHLFVDNIINLKNPREATEDLSQLIKNQVR